jgi:hypothetical protein
MGTTHKLRAENQILTYNYKEIGQSWYEITPIVDPKLVVDRALPPRFVFLYLKDGEQIRSFISADAPPSTLRQFGQPKVRLPLIYDKAEVTPELLSLAKARNGDPYIPTKVFGKEAFLRRTREFYDCDFAVHDILGTIDMAPDNVAVIVGVAHDPKLTTILRNRVKNLTKKRPLDVEARNLNEKLAEVPYLVRLIVVSDDKRKRDVVINDITAKSNKLLRWKAVFSPDWLKFLKKLRPPKLTAKDMFTGGIMGFTNLTTTQKVLNTWLKIPNPKYHPISFAAERGVPTRITLKRTEDSFTIGKTPDGVEVFLTTQILKRHLYTIGQSGSGKTTFLKTLVHRMREKADGAIVIIDPHGDFAEEVAREIPDAIYLHPIDSPFGLNPLDLPMYLDKDLAITLATDALLGLFTNVFKLLENAVNVRYLLRVVLRYLYSKTLNPTLGMMYKTILMLYSGLLNFDIDDEEFERQLRVLRDMPEQSFISALARLEPFANDAVLRRLTSQTTIPFDRLIREKRVIAISIPKAKVGEIVSSLLSATILLYIWYYAISRPQNYRVPIYTIIDEFQNLQGLATVETILSEARKYGLHLVLSHQHTKQIDEALLQSILTNCATKVIFQVGGADVHTLKRLDPAFEEEIEKLIAHLKVGEAVVKITPPTREDIPPILTLIDCVEAQQKRSDIYTDRFAPWSTPPPPEEVICPPLKYIEPPYYVAHKLMTLLAREGEMSMTKMSTLLAVDKRHVNRAIQSLIERGHIESVSEGKSISFRLSDNFYELFYPSAPSQEGQELIRCAVDYYLKRDYSVNPIKLQASEDRPDMVAIPFKGLKLQYSKAVAVEIEAHPRKEFVLRNLTKSSVDDFAEIHVWTHRQNAKYVADGESTLEETFPTPPPETASSKESTEGVVKPENKQIRPPEGTTPIVYERDGVIYGPGLVIHKESAINAMGEEELKMMIKETLLNYLQTQKDKLALDTNLDALADKLSDIAMEGETVDFSVILQVEEKLRNSSENSEEDAPLVYERDGVIYGPGLVIHKESAINAMGEEALREMIRDALLNYLQSQRVRIPPDTDLETFAREFTEKVMCGESITLTDVLPSVRDKKVERKRKTSLVEPHTKIRKETNISEPKAEDTEESPVTKPPATPPVISHEMSEHKPQQVQPSRNVPKRNVDEFFVEDKVVALPRGERVALFAKPEIVEKIKKMMADPGFDYDLQPTKVPGKIFDLVIYVNGRPAGIHRCKLLSEDLPI